MSVGLPIGLPRRIQDQDDAALADLVQGDEMVFLVASGRFANFGRRRYDPRWFSGSGSDWTTRFQAALAEANGAGRALVVPHGVRNITGQLTIDEVDVYGEAPGAVIKVASSLGDTVSAMRVTLTSRTEGQRMPVLQGFGLVGPGSYALGQKNAICDGIEIVGQAKPVLRDLSISRFDAGVVFNNDVGHIYVDNSEIANCYYGITIRKDNHDYYVRNCALTGQNMASLGLSGNVGMSGGFFYDNHFGYSPYGIYQDANTNGQETPFLTYSRIESRFEACGNGAIFSELSGGAPDYGWVNDARMIDIGFSWGNSYRIAGRPKDYSVVIPAAQGPMQFDGGAAPFGKGDVGTMLVKSAPYVTDSIYYGFLGNGWTDDGTLLTVESGKIPYSVGVNRGGYGISHQKIEHIFTVGTQDAVPAATAGAFHGWIFHSDEPWMISKYRVECVEGAPNTNIKFTVFDARNGLTDMPKLFREAGATTISTTGVKNLGFSAERFPAGTYVVGVLLSTNINSFAGASANNLAQMRGAVVASSNVLGDDPSTLTVTRSTTGINLAIGNV